MATSQYVENSAKKASLFEKKKMNLLCKCVPQLPIESLTMSMAHSKVVIMTQCIKHDGLDGRVKNIKFRTNM